MISLQKMNASVLFIILLQTYVVLSGWQENFRPKMFVQLGRGDALTFRGNETVADYFLEMYILDKYVLVGGRDMVYNLSLSNLKEQQHIEWVAGEKEKKMCVVKGKSEELCHNYIKVLKAISSTTILVCGTNAYKPVCREYVEDGGSYGIINERSGVGMCPVSPVHNSTAVLVDGDLFSGTVADLQAVDPLIYRNPLRTEQYDSTALNSPNFVGSFSDEEYVYFFFREGAVEYINCGKAVFSRVARVCKNDRGATHKFQKRWTSFLKTRLNCSVPGNYPFYFDEVQSSSAVINGIYGGAREKIVYATFTTSPNSIRGSAVCAFKLKDISRAFDGRFKEQESISSNWLPLRNDKVPASRPGTCVNDSRTLPEATLNFIKTHTLMNEAVPPFFGEPIVVRSGGGSTFTKIAVDPQVKTVEGKIYDVIFVATSDGRILKSINAKASDSKKFVRSVIIEELQLSTSPITIQNMEVARQKKGQNKLVILTDTEVHSIPLARCDKISLCNECIALQDPYCAWNKNSNRCVYVTKSKKGVKVNSELLQSISNGKHKHCPQSLNGQDKQSRMATESEVVDSSHRVGKTVPMAEVINIVKDNVVSSKVGLGDDPDSSLFPEAVKPLYSVETLVITVSAGAVAALVIGFVTGYCCGRKCRKDEILMPYQDTEYEYFEQRQNAARPGTLLAPAESKTISQQQEEVTYAEPILIPQTTMSNVSSMNTLSKAYNSQLNTNFNKFNTMGHNFKRTNGPLPQLPMEALLQRDRDGSLPPSQNCLGGGPPYTRGRDNFNGITQSPNMSFAHNTSTYQRSKLRDRDKNEHQLVDSAYGTTRSVKKVYL